MSVSLRSDGRRAREYRTELMKDPTCPQGVLVLAQPIEDFLAARYPGFYRNTASDERRGACAGLCYLGPE